MRTLPSSLVALTLGLAALATPTRGADEKALDNATARMEAARKVYKGMFRRREMSPADAPSVEDMYRWSLRWMDAEQEVNATKEGRIAAARAHLERMKKWEDFLRDQVKGSLAAPYEVAAGEYYRLEAERRLAQCKGD